MNKHKEYIIPFVGLNNETHRFSYFIDDSFFAMFDISEISRAGVQIELDLDKSDRMLVLNFNMKGFIGVTCSRCLDEFDLEVEGEQEFFVKFGPEYKEEDDNVLILPEGASQLDIAGLIFDYIHLMIPYRVVHQENEEGETACDPEVIERLIQLSQKVEKDSPWEKLKDIKLD